MFKYLSYIFLIIFITLFYLGYSNYTGSKLFYSIFGISALIMIFTLFRKEFYFFEIFFVIIVFITFWLDFVVTISFYNSIFIEGAGRFDFEPYSLNEVLLISTFLFLSISAAIVCRSKILPKKNIKNKILLNKNNYNYFKNKQLSFILFFILLVIFVSFANFYFSIYQRGVISKYSLNPFFEGIIKWLLLFGFSSFLCILIDFVISNKFIKKTHNYLFYSLVVIIETFITNISMLSRGNFLNSSSVIFAMYKQIHKNRDIFLIISFIIIFLFFFLGMEILSPFRGDPSLMHSMTEKINFEKLNVVNNFFTLIKNFLETAFGRISGIEALMAVHSFDNLSFDLLLDAMRDRPEVGKASFFDSLKNDFRVNNANKVSITLPGIIGFLYYSGSIYFLLISVFIIVIFFSFVELIIFKFCNNNLLICSLFSQVIAFRLWHFGYNFPNTYSIIIAIFFNIFIIAIFYRFIKLKNK
jgi:hypothetical protein